MACGHMPVTCCCVLMHAVTRCCTLPHTAAYCYMQVHAVSLTHASTRCCMLSLAASCCRMLLRAGTHCCMLMLPDHTQASSHLNTHMHASGRAAAHAHARAHTHADAHACESARSACTKHSHAGMAASRRQTTTQSRLSFVATGFICFPSWRCAGVACASLFLGELQSVLSTCRSRLAELTAENAAAKVRCALDAMRQLSTRCSPAAISCMCVCMQPCPGVRGGVCACM